MSLSQNMTIDELIRRIYSVYIDIKTNELDEVKKDIMLDDIKMLYLKVKDLMPDTVELTEKHREVVATIPVKEISIEESPEHAVEETPVQPIDMPVENLGVEPKIERPVEKNIIAPAPKEELQRFEIDFDAMKVPENAEHSKQNTTKQEEKYIEKSVKITPDTQPFSMAKETPISEPPQEKTTAVEPEKTSLKSEHIQKFLSKDESPKREIFEFIDLNTRIGLVEQFFKGNSIDLSECLMRMNKSQSKAETLQILQHYQKQYGIQPTDNIYMVFEDVINRMYA